MQNIENTRVRGAIYIRGAAINEEKVKGSNKVIVITPPVPRRADWKDDETSIFYIKCDSKMQRHAVSYSTEFCAIAMAIFHAYNNYTIVPALHLCRDYLQ